MKHKLGLLGIGLAAILLSSAVIAQKAPETKKTRHIKLMKVENGKTMKLDTVLTGDEVFVWNGDTINPMKHSSKSGAPEFGKMHRFDVEVENDNGDEKVRIYKHRAKKDGEPMLWGMESGDNMQVFSDVEGDSVQHKIIIHKRMKGGDDEDNFIYLNGENMKHFPPMPPMPPVPHNRMLKEVHAGRIIDLNDPNIISFRKKKLSGDREKIEIIRKKPEGPQHLTYDIDMDDAMFTPEPPEPPVFMNEFNNDRPEKKIIEKDMKVDEKKEKKTEEKVNPGENK
jgi:hypothetical protein